MQMPRMQTQHKQSYRRIRLVEVSLWGKPLQISKAGEAMKPNRELADNELLFKLRAINFAEGGDNSREFYKKVDMPDGRSAWVVVVERGSEDKVAP